MAELSENLIKFISTKCFLFFLKLVVQVTNRFSHIFVVMRQNNIVKNEKVFLAISRCIIFTKILVEQIMFLKDESCTVFIRLEFYYVEKPQKLIVVLLFFPFSLISTTCYASTLTKN